MPFHTADPVLLVEESRLRNNIDTKDPESLFGMWSVFHKCAGILENGRRLENLSWRVFAHETLCVSPSRHIQRKAVHIHHNPPQSRTPVTIPELSSSVESSASTHFDDSFDTSPESRGPLSASLERSRTIDKHITPVDLQNLVISIKVKQDLTGPLSPLPNIHAIIDRDQECRNMEERRGSYATRKASLSQQSESVQDSIPTPRPLSPRPLESSASTIASDSASLDLVNSRSNTSETSADSDLGHSVVRGFQTGMSGVSTYRSQSQLHLSGTSSQSSNAQAQAETETTLPRKKGGMFTLGGSLTEDDASVKENHSPQSQGSAGPSSSFRYNTHKKHASFLEKVVEIPKKKFILSTSAEEGNAIESDDDDEYESDEDISESAIEDDDDWEDEAESEENSRPLTFPRVESRVNLNSRRSIITQGLHETQRAAAMQNAASRSTPMLRRSRTSTPNGPSIPASPEAQPSNFDSPHTTVAPIMLPQINVVPAAQPPLSPRATRRNMLTSELGVSLRKHMLNERQQRNVPYSNVAAALQRRHTSQNLAGMTQYPGPSQQPPTASRNNSFHDYNDYGSGDYHQTGW